MEAPAHPEARIRECHSPLPGTRGCEEGSSPQPAPREPSVSCNRKSQTQKARASGPRDGPGGKWSTEEVERGCPGWLGGASAGGYEVSPGAMEIAGTMCHAATDLVPQGCPPTQAGDPGPRAALPARGGQESKAAWEKRSRWRTPCCPAHSKKARQAWLCDCRPVSGLADLQCPYLHNRSQCSAPQVTGALPGHTQPGRAGPRSSSQQGPTGSHV